ncbi:vitamin B12 independent methionine synthase [Leuconostoc carnosum]|uniref:vitamin B12 independent methionine synthase n=1 Tax=Leuconostoc carnosum TaxID=1252 RepID=UPI00123ADFCD|nr:vitamin B12 independent methionine synthase [Leuconostoc carnosum]KAA8370375.1 vitamin B12 independent methionine synthase [Leuconostoc carnosum]KAA8382022.1 vitamin B12 independent methionine synthase [Leuconostoc carnosum]
MTITGKLNYRFDQVGSYLRPENLKQARAAYDEGKITHEELLAVQHTEIKKLVDKQVAVGLQAVTDGEFNRSWWHLDFLGQLGGFEFYDQEDSYKFHGEKTRSTNIRLNGKVHANLEHPFFKDFQYLQSIVPEGVEPKQTIPSPSLIINRDHRSDLWSEYYATWEDFLDDLALAYHDTLQHFYDLGARYIQLDDTTWGYLIAQLNANADNASARAQFEKTAQDDVYVINKALAGLPSDLKLSTHVCRGNFKSTYLFEGGYEAVAKYLGQLNYDAFFLEYDNDRSGGFEPLKDIYNGRNNVAIVLGLLTSKSADLEKVDDVVARINEAAKFVPKSQLALSTQCGFSSTEEGNILTIPDQWKKLALIKRIADEQFV